MQHTKPASGHPPDTPLSTSWLVPVRELARSAWVAGAYGETASPKICGWLTGSLSIAHARSTVVERSGGMSTGPAHGPRIRSLAQSASRFTTPFFPPLPGRPIVRRNSADSTSRRSDCSRSCCSWDSSLARAARSSWALASCANACLRQVLRDRSTAAAWFRHLLHSARSSRYFSRSLLRLFNKDRTRIRRGDFASSVLFKIRFDPTPLASMPKLLASETPS